MSNMPDVPTFSTWDRRSLDRFAHDCYIRLKAEQQANEQLRLDLKDAMILLRKELNRNNHA